MSRVFNSTKSTIKKIVNYNPFLDYRLKTKLKNAERKIFIDCGANTGQVFQNFYATREGFTFHLFEPQPELTQSLEELVEKTADPNVSFHNKAVWIRNEELEFYLATNWGPNHRGGSTLLHGQTNNESNVDYQKPVMVEAIDFTQWLTETIKIGPKDYIVIKMDIEGAEYDILEKMIAQDLLKYINELFVEFHFQMSEDKETAYSRHVSVIRSINQQKNLKLTKWH